MPLQCNIDSRGKVARLVWGVLLIAGGIAAALLWALPGGSAWAWAACGLAVLGGAFAVFEARAGWCVIRAMGLKTPI